MMDISESESTVVPDSIMDSVKKTLTSVEDVRKHMLEFLSLSDPEVLAEMPPLQRAHSLLLFAKATSALFTSKFPSLFLTAFDVYVFGILFQCCWFECLILIFLFLIMFFPVRLRCSGVHPDEHPVITELVGFSVALFWSLFREFGFMGTLFVYSVLWVFSNG